jgi:protein-tyrosine phosphatase
LTDDATLDDRELIREELGIKSVLDLRTKYDLCVDFHLFSDLHQSRTEHLKQAEKRKADSETPALLKSNAALAEPLHVQGLEYHEIRITGRSFEMFLLKQLSWPSLL